MFDHDNLPTMVRDTGPGREWDAPCNRNHMNSAGMNPADSPCWRRRNQAEAQVVVPVARVVPVAIRGAYVPGVVVPVATTIHTVGAALSPVPLTEMVR